MLYSHDLAQLWFSHFRISLSRHFHDSNIICVYVCIHRLLRIVLLMIVKDFVIN